MTDATPLASEQITDPKYIYLQPNCCVDPQGEGRHWCEDDSVWEECYEEGCQCKAVRYVREDLAALSATPAPSDQDASQAQGERLALEAIKAVTATTKDAVAGLSRIMAITRSAGVVEPYSELMAKPDVALIVNEPRTEWKHLFDRPASCTIPPAEWRCTRTPGHDGPCAAVPAPGATVQDGVGLTANSVDLVEGVCAPMKALSPDYDPLNSLVSENLPRWILDGWTNGNETYEEASEAMQEMAQYAARAVEAGIRADMESMAPATPTPTIPAGMVADQVRSILLTAGVHEDTDTAIGLIPYPVTARAVRDALAAAPTPQAPVGQEVDRVMIRAVVSLRAAISLLKGGGKKAAPSDKMFAQMLADYTRAANNAAAALASLNPTTGAGETEGGK